MTLSSNNGLFSIANSLNGRQQSSSLGLAAAYPASTNLLASIGGLRAAVPNAAVPPWTYVTRRFTAFQDNLALTPNQITDGETKYKGVVSCLNLAYYGHNSEVQNAFLIGSWAKGTRTRPPRDVDLYFVLPISVYERFQAYSSNVNKQSALLQEVKGKLAAKYSSSAIKGDGPVVWAKFESYNVEVVPAFVYDNADRSYYVCDTKNGGKYLTTKPLHEVDKIHASDVLNNGNVRHLVRMLKCWQAWCSVPLKSFYLELLACDFVEQWPYRDRGYFFHDWMCRDFFAWLITKADGYVFAPGTYEVLWLGNAWKSRAETAHGRASKACEYEQSNDEANAGDEWQKIFGTFIPKWV